MKGPLVNLVVATVAVIATVAAGAMVLLVLFPVLAFIAAGLLLTVLVSGLIVWLRVRRILRGGGDRSGPGARTAGSSRRPSRRVKVRVIRNGDDPDDR